MTEKTALTLEYLATPSLILDRARLERNAAFMSRRMRDMGVRLRPHLKTAKSADVARIATAGHFGGITVSTLAEARYFAQNGILDIVYAVTLAPQKLSIVADLHAEFGVRVTVLTDDVGVARSIAERAAEMPAELPVLLEIDCGGGRAGVTLDDPNLLEIGRILEAPANVSFEGVLTHAGQSYHCRSIAEITEVAAAERDAVVKAARALEAVGIACKTISGGATPTALQAANFDGMTEMRPGVYVFSDLMQTALGWGGHGDIAVSVLATVIGHRRDLGQILIDAGGLALSKDRGMDQIDPSVGMGLICDKLGQRLFAGLRVDDTHQEHGILRMNDGAEPPWDDLAIGARVRVLPVHVCMTAAAFERYHVVADADDVVIDEWTRARGW
jgi:D-serine deaminase-like pyridoxal phosphate-dependent protein